MVKKDDDVCCVSRVGGGGGGGNGGESGSARALILLALLLSPLLYCMHGKIFWGLCCKMFFDTSEAVVMKVVVTLSVVRLSERIEGREATLIPRGLSTKSTIGVGNKGMMETETSSGIMSCDDENACDGESL